MHFFKPRILKTSKTSYHPFHSKTEVNEGLTENIKFIIHFTCTIQFIFNYTHTFKSIQYLVHCNGQVIYPKIQNSWTRSPYNLYITHTHWDYLSHIPCCHHLHCLHLSVSLVSSTSPSSYSCLPYPYHLQLHLGCL